MIFIVRQLVEVTPCQSGVHEIDSRNVLYLVSIVPNYRNLETFLQLK